MKNSGDDQCRVSLYEKRAYNFLMREKSQTKRKTHSHQMHCDLALLLGHDGNLKDQAVDTWLQNQRDFEAPLMPWLNAVFLGLLDA